MFSPDTESNGALILDFQPSKLWEINVYVYSHLFLSFDNFVITAWMDSGGYWASHLKQWWVLASFLLLMFCLCPHADLFVPANTVQSARLGMHILLLFFFSSMIIPPVVNCIFVCVFCLFWSCGYFKTLAEQMFFCNHLQNVLIFHCKLKNDTDDSNMQQRALWLLVFNQSLSTGQRMSQLPFRIFYIVWSSWIYMIGNINTNLPKDYITSQVNCKALRKLFNGCNMLLQRTQYSVMVIGLCCA